MNLTDLAFGNERLDTINLKTAKKEFPREYHERPINESTPQRVLAEIAFVKNEVGVIGLIREGKVCPPQGREEPILVGYWKYEDGVYVRAGIDSKALVVFNPYESWSFDIRTDCKEQSFFYPWNTGHGQSLISPKVLQRAIDVANRVTQAVRGYEQVMFSRNPKKLD